MYARQRLAEVFKVVPPGLAAIPDFSSAEYLTSCGEMAAIIPVYSSRVDHLCSYLSRLGYQGVIPYKYPVVPKDASRIRISVHVHNIDAQIDQLAVDIHMWAKTFAERNFDDSSNIAYAEKSECDGHIAYGVTSGGPGGCERGALEVGVRDSLY
jgi:hypothetical protein